MDNYSNLLMDECPPDLRSPEDESKPPIRKPLKGVSTSFGFRKKTTSPTSTITTNNPVAARRLANSPVDDNGNSGPILTTNETASLTLHAVPSARSIPHRLPPPKKEAQANTKPSRFGFRQPNANRLNRVADINVNPPTRIEFCNNNVTTTDTKEREKIESEIKAKVEMQQRQMLTTDSNKNSSNNSRQIGKYTLHTNQLPRPQPVKLLETKMAKTLANNSKKQNVRITTSGDESSYCTEDSGVGSNCGDNIKQLEKSPMSRRMRSNKLAKPRTLEVVVTGNNKFDVRDLEDDQTDAKMPTLPSLPSLQTQESSHGTRPRPNLGFVQNRALAYQRNVIDKMEQHSQRSEHVRKHSFTSSEASSHCDEDNSFIRNEKIAKFIKQKPPVSVTTEHSSSDDQMWSTHAGEAMAEEFSSVCLSSSDESNNKDKASSIMEASIESLISAKAMNRLSLVDPQFAAIAESNIAAPLIVDETSPEDSIACSTLSDNNEPQPDNDKKIDKSMPSSNSKDINEKNPGSTPGSPTNASNSLSLSDGRDDFLIDDEIADQPALLFDDTLTNSNQPSEATSTIVDSTPKPLRRAVVPYESSPLSLRNRKLGRARTGSLDTLSPCESIASDDCMMDYDLSSGVEDGNDRTDLNSHYNLEDVPVRSVDIKINNIRDWNAIISSCDIGRESSRRMSFRSSRLLKSRGGTPTSSVTDSPRSDVVKKTSVSQSPLRLSSRSSGTGYESDDSGVIRLDRSQHCAIQQDVMGIKTMLLKLKRVLHEPATEDYMLMSETHNSLNENGFFTGYGSDYDKDPEEENVREEMENLRRQVIFLQGQLEDSERATQNLREEMVTLTMKYQSSQSAPASVTTTTKVQTSTCNAATQTERIRPISAGPALLQDVNDLSPGSLVSVSEQNQTHLPVASRRSRNVQNQQTPPLNSSTPTKNNSSNSLLPSPNRLWRMPGEPPSPSSIPKRSCSRSRIANNNSLTTTSTTSPT